MPVYTQDDVTVLIAARNAQETIRRTVASVRAQSSCPIVLVDDFSEDATVNLARLEGGSGLSVIRPPYHGALGFTRQCGLNVIQTPLTLLLDADDAFLPGRVTRFAQQMHKQSFSIWADELLLFDGSSNALVRHIAIPDFIASAPVPYRLFERNYLPGVGQVGYRTELAKAVGYDPELHGPEDIDLVLRMMLQGARFAYDRQAGYAMYAYPTSVSRNLERQKAMYARSLAKFQEQVVERFYLRHGASQRQAFTGVLLMLVHQSRYVEALSMLLGVQDTGAEAKEVPSESQNVHDDELWEWRLRFYRGSLYLKADQPDLAVQALNQALTFRVSPDTLNNLGCALKKLERLDEANQCFLKALQFKPHYLDAKENLSNSNSMFVTLPEIRSFTSRDVY
jgi:glycosyltransferase involved in cell wall biosynthesis